MSKLTVSIILSIIGFIPPIAMLFADAEYKPTTIGFCVLVVGAIIHTVVQLNLSKEGNGWAKFVGFLVIIGVSFSVGVNV